MGDISAKTTQLSGNGRGLPFLDLLATFIAYRKPIILATLITLIMAVIYSVGSLLLPPGKSYYPNIYKPEAMMLVNSPPSSAGLSSMLSASGVSGLADLAGLSVGGQEYGELAVAIAKSNTILDALIEKFDLVARYGIKNSPKTLTRMALLKRYSATYDDKTGLLRINYKDRDPEMARDLVNYAVGLLDQRFTMIGGNRNVLKKEQLELKLADVQAEMTRIENEIQDFQRQHGVITVDSIATEQVSTVAQVRSELIMKEMEIKTYGDISRVQDPALMRLIAERDNLSKLLGELEKGFSQYEKVLPSQRELPALAIHFGHLQRDLEIQEKVFELLTQQYELTKLQISGSDPIIQVIEPAEAPDRKFGPSRGLLCISATLAALLISTLAAFLIQAVKTIKSDPEAMAKLRGVSK